MFIPVKMVNAIGVEKGTSSFHAVYFIPLFEEKFCEVRTILTGNTGD